MGDARKSRYGQMNDHCDALTNSFPVARRDAAKGLVELDAWEARGQLAVTL